MPRDAETHEQNGRRSGPLGTSAAGRLLARLAEPVYRRAITRRNRDFDADVGVWQLDRPVVSVGNLSVGGTGKTPLVAKLVGELVRAGRRPCIAMRGYGKKRSASGRSDEAEEYERLIPGAPVVAQADRIAGLTDLFATEAGKGVDTVVLDDGFQHRQILRDVDIVLVDASAGTPEDQLLPLGWLREPMASLRRADAVVVTHAERASAAEVARVRGEALRVNPDLVVAVCRHAWTGLRTDEDVAPAGVLEDRSVLAVCAIGNPSAFVEAVRDAGGVIGDVVALPDHDPYAPATVRRIREAAQGVDAIVTTEKDWVKLGRADVAWPCPVYRPVLELAFDRGWEELWGLVRRGVEEGGAGGPTLSVSVASTRGAERGP